MPRLALVLAVASMLAGRATAAEVAVRVSGERVDLRATAAPLADVLDRLSRQTGMKVIYEGAPPRQTVTLALTGRSQAETVLTLLEGQGLNFALVADATGSRIDTLIVAGAAGTGTSSGSARAAAATPPRTTRRPFRPTVPPGASPDALDAGFDDAMDDLEEDPYDEGPLPGEDLPEDADPGEDLEALPDPAAPTPPEAAPPALPFPTAPTSSASPFTPQPFSVQPFPPAPPGTPGAATNEETAPDQAPFR